MVRCNNFYSTFVSCCYDLFLRSHPCKCFYIYKINISCFSQQRCLILYKVRLRLLFSPPSFDVRNVKRIGVSPKASLKSFNTSSTLSNSKTPSNQSTRHSTTSTGMLSNVFASAMISSFVTPTIGTQILGTPLPISTFLTFYCIH